MARILDNFKVFLERYGPQMGFPCDSLVKNSPEKVGGSPGEGNGNPPQYSCQGNSMGRGAWWAIVHRVTRVWKEFMTKQQQRTPDRTLSKVFWFKNWRVQCCSFLSVVCFPPSKLTLAQHHSLLKPVGSARHSLLNCPVPTLLLSTSSSGNWSQQLHTEKKDGMLPPVSFGHSDLGA